MAYLQLGLFVGIPLAFAIVGLNLGRKGKDLGPEEKVIAETDEMTVVAD